MTPGEALFWFGVLLIVLGAGMALEKNFGPRASPPRAAMQKAFLAMRLRERERCAAALDERALEYEDASHEFPAASPEGWQAKDYAMIYREAARTLRALPDDPDSEVP